jgi:uncharacterized protein YjaZ
MSSDLVNIEFYFPEKTEDIASKDKLATLILDMMKEQKSIQYAGFSDEKILLKKVIDHLGDAGVDQYKQLTKEQRDEIEGCIEKTVMDCNSRLPVPTKNYVFVLPYMPIADEDVFEGVMGFSPYSCVFYIFVSPSKWSQKAIMNTVAHELNHTIFFYHHYDDFGNYSLFEEMIMEGLAENFRELGKDKTPAAWAVAFNEDNAKKIFNDMDEKVLFSKDKDLIKGVMFGNEDYKRWTGYSIGYWLVKELVSKNSELNWDSIMKLSTRDILNMVDKEKEVPQS